MGIPSWENRGRCDERRGPRRVRVGRRDSKRNVGNKDTTAVGRNAESEPNVRARSSGNLAAHSHSGTSACSRPLRDFGARSISTRRTQCKVHETRVRLGQPPLLVPLVLALQLWPGLYDRQRARSDRANSTSWGIWTRYRLSIRVPTSPRFARYRESPA